MSTNVKVAVRCRPVVPLEHERAAETVVFVMGKKVLLVPPAGQRDKIKEYDFYFDYAYGMESHQRQLYEDIGKDILDGALEGYNGTIFAYGQTGSGKTHTILGEPDDPGLALLMYKDLFSRIAQSDAEEKEFLVTVSFLEIYNETLFDLLNPSDKKLNIRESSDSGIFVDGLAELVVRSFEDLVRLLHEGVSMRSTAATKMNDRSSRSHCIFQVRVEQKFINTESTTKALFSKLNLVDLAGSERVGAAGASGQLFKEGTAINKSLSALGVIINQLADPKQRNGYIGYRDSKLTRMLQDALGGNMRTAMIATVSPADSNHAESLSTLQYANRAKNIQNVAKQNAELNPKMVKELQIEIENLRIQLFKNQSDIQAQNRMKCLLDQKERDMKELADTHRQTWEEKEALSRRYEEERDRNTARQEALTNELEAISAEKKSLSARLKAVETPRVHVESLDWLRKMYARSLPDMIGLDTAEGDVMSHIVSGPRASDVPLSDDEKTKISTMTAARSAGFKSLLSSFSVTEAEIKLVDLLSIEERLAEEVGLRRLLAARVLTLLERQQQLMKDTSKNEETLRLEMAQARVQAKAFEEQIASQAEELKASAGREEQLHGEVATLSADVERLRGVDQQLNQLREQSAGQGVELNDAQQRAARLQTELDRRQKDLDEFLGAQKRLKEAMQEVEGRATSEIKRLKQKRAELEQELEGRQSKILGLEQKLQNKDREISELEAAKMSLNQAVEDERSASAKLRDNLGQNAEQLRSDLAEREGEVRSLEGKLRSKDTELKERETSLGEQIRTLRLELEDWQHRDKEWSGTLSSVQAERDSLTAEHSALSAEIESLKGQIETLKKQGTESDAMTSNLELRLSELRNQVEKAEGQIKADAVSMEQLQKQLSASQSEKGASDTLVSDLEEKQRQLAGTIATLEQNLEDEGRKVVSLQHKLDASAKEVERLEERAAARLQTSEDLKTEVNAERARADEARQEGALKDTEIANLKEKLAQLQRHLAEKETTSDDITKLLSEAKSSLAVKEEELNLANRAVQDKEHTIKSLTRELEEARALVEKKNSDLSSKTDIASSLERRVDEMEIQIHQVSGERDGLKAEVARLRHAADSTAKDGESMSTRISQLEDELRSAREEIENWDVRYNKVVTAHANHKANMAEDTSRLQAEIETLKEQQKDMNEMQSSLDSAQAQCKKLKAQLDRSEELEKERASNEGRLQGEVRVLQLEISVLKGKGETSEVDLRHMKETTLEYEDRIKSLTAQASQQESSIASLQDKVGSLTADLKKSSAAASKAQDEKAEVETQLEQVRKEEGRMNREMEILISKSENLENEREDMAHKLREANRASTEADGRATILQRQLTSAQEECDDALRRLQENEEAYEQTRRAEMDLKANVARLQRECDSLRERETACARRADTAESRVKELEATSTAADETISRLRSELATRTGAVESQRANDQERIEELMKARAAAVEEAALATRHSKNAEAQVDESRRRARELKSELEAAEEDLRSVEAKLTQASVAGREKDAEISRLQAKGEKADRTIAELTDAEHALSLEKKELQNKLHAVTNELEVLQSCTLTKATSQENHVQELTREINEEKGRARKLERQVGDLQSELKTTMDRKTSLELAHDEEKARMEQAEADLQKQLVSLRAELSTAKGTLVSESDRYHSEHELRIESEEQCRQLKVQVEDLGMQVDTLQQKMQAESTLRGDLEEGERKFMTELRLAKENFTNAEQQVDTLQRRLAAANEELATMRVSVDEGEHERSNLQAKMASIESENSRLTTQVDECRSQIQENYDRQDEMNKTELALRMELAAVKSELEVLGAMSNPSESRDAVMDELRDDLQNEKSKSREVLAVLEERERQLDELQKQIKSNVTSREDRLTEIEKNDEMIRNLRNELEAANDLADARARKLNVESGALRELQDKFDEMESDLRKTRSELKQKEFEIERHVQRKEVSDATIEDLQTSNDKLLAEMRALRSSNAEFKDEADKAKRRSDENSNAIADMEQKLQQAQAKWEEEADARREAEAQLSGLKQRRNREDTIAHELAQQEARHKSEMVALASELNAYQDEIGALKAEYDAKFGDAETNTAGIKSQLEDALERERRSQQHLQTERQECAKLARQLHLSSERGAKVTSLEEKVKELRDLVQQSELGMEEEKEKLRRSKEANRRLQETIEDYEDRVRRLEDRAPVSAPDPGVDAAALELATGELRAELEELNIRFNDKCSQVAVLEDEQTSLQERLEMSEERVRDLESTIDAAVPAPDQHAQGAPEPTGDIADALQRIDELSRLLAQREAELDEVQKKHQDELKAEIAKANDEGAVMSVRERRMKAMLDEYEGRLQDYEQRSRRQSQGEALALKQLEKLRAKETDLKNELENANLQAKIKMQGDSEEQDKMISQLESTNAELKSEVASMEDTIYFLNGELEALEQCRADLANAQRQVDDMRQELDDARESLYNKDQEKIHMEEHETLLQTELAELRQQLETSDGPAGDGALKAEHDQLLLKLSNHEKIAAAFEQKYNTSQADLDAERKRRQDEERAGQQTRARMEHLLARVSDVENMNYALEEKCKEHENKAKQLEARMMTRASEDQMKRLSARTSRGLDYRRLMEQVDSARMDHTALRESVAVEMKRMHVDIASTVKNALREREKFVSGTYEKLLEEQQRDHQKQKDKLATHHSDEKNRMRQVHLEELSKQSAAGGGEGHSHGSCETMIRDLQEQRAGLKTTLAKTRESLAAVQAKQKLFEDENAELRAKLGLGASVMPRSPGAGPAPTSPASPSRPTPPRGPRPPGPSPPSGPPPNIARR